MVRKKYHQNLEPTESFCFAQNDEQKNVILAAQTTQNLQEWKICKKFIKKRFTNAKIFDTICSVTEDRQTEALALASQSDGMLVIGGRDSSNTGKLYEICKGVCPFTQWIESARDLEEPFPFMGRNKIGITAGASTPRGIILEVEKQMENFAAFAGIVHGADRLQYANG